MCECCDVYVFTRDADHGGVLGLVRCQAYAPATLSFATIVWVALLAFGVAGALGGNVSWGAVVVAEVEHVVIRKRGKACLTEVRVGRSTLGLHHLRHHRRNSKPHNLRIIKKPPRVSTLLPV